MCHHVGEHNEAVKKGSWSTSIDFCFWNYPLLELAGKTMGLIGFGRIGQATAKIATAFGLNVLAFDPDFNPEMENNNCKFSALDDLFARSDIVSLHCPLLESTMGIINKHNIEKMKDGVMIINTSRGLLIIEKDLSNALNSGKLQEQLSMLFQMSQ